MSSPLTGAGYLHVLPGAGTKEEVLARCFNAIANNDYRRETASERAERYLDELHAKAVWDANTFSGPVFQIVGPIKPIRGREYTHKDTYKGIFWQRWK
ncbi:hypothetical protein GTGU_00273 [Trabulsiella guamensis ATCC 49490]|uniref:Uncharacterized protein n=1 Tax=Trabulsiella guamensis ATCC 49490 TaxID=1005994 RepID=A0A085AR63_9ENTR|nr:hypothetical protein [Trabulsiella guamensis]KFC12708.1 hypothetical protein GTGU_00273 [Trabulsiella guamensis ATCC 49490]